MNWSSFLIPIGFCVTMELYVDRGMHEKKLRKKESPRLLLTEKLVTKLQG